MKVKFKPLGEMTTTGVAFANAPTSIPQTVLGGKPSDAYKRGAIKFRWRGKLTNRERLGQGEVA